MKSFINLVELVKSKFETDIDLFDVTEITAKKPLIISEFQQFEEQLGFNLPESIKQIYLNECSELSFYWWMNESAAKEFGYNIDEYVPLGEIHFLSPQIIVREKKNLEKLYEDDKSIIQNLIPIFDYEPAGDMYCLSFNQGKDSNKVAIISLYHDAEPTNIILGDSFEDFVENWSKIGFINEFNPDGIDFEDKLLKPIANFLKR